jgi:hypothetical protein
MARMLMLYFEIKDDQESQQLAKFVKDGFRYESWKALQEASTVYEARITALPHPDYPAKFSSILLSTTYDGGAEPYQHFFWDKLAPFFVMVALSAKAPPFTIADLIPEQQAAFAVAHAAIAKCEGSTPETFDANQAEFRQATKALSDALAMDDQRKRDQVIAKTKFELFAEWVDRNDLTYPVGSPAENGFRTNHDLRVPPVLNERSNFLNPAVAPGPFPVKSQ